MINMLKSPVKWPRRRPTEDLPGQTVDLTEPTAQEHGPLPDLDSTTQPAAAALLVIVVAITVTLIFNSAGVLHMALGMSPGPVRSVAVGVLRPINTVTGALWLDEPKKALDQLFGHELDATGGAGLENGNDSILTTGAGVGQTAVPMEPAIVSPTQVDPLRVLVLGDSLSRFVGQRLDQRSQIKDLVRVRQLYRNGTGVTSPDFFNWQAAATAEAKRTRAQAVVMVVGVSDSMGMTHNGQSVPADSSSWQTEYARRVAVIMKSLTDAGVQRVYWSGPPTARDDRWNETFGRINAAVTRAATAVPGARFVDLYHGQNGSSNYSKVAIVDGSTIRARQADGVNYTFAGSLPPAQLIEAAIQGDYRDIL